VGTRNSETMQMLRHKRFRYLAGIIAILIFGQTALGDLTVRFAPPTNSVQPGGMFTIDIVADVDPLEPLLGWGLDLAFDASILSLVQPPMIAPGWFAASAADSDGLVGLAFPNSISGPNIPLATLTFTADAIGMSGLSLSATSGDLTEGFALDAQGFANPTFQPGQVSVVPAPGAAVLALIGLPMVAWVRRRSM